MVRKFLTIAAAGAMALGPVAAQAAAPVSDVRVGAQIDDASELRGRNSAVLIGLILVVIFLAIVTADSRDEPSNSP